MSDLYIQRSNYYLSLSEQRIIIKNDNKEYVKIETGPGKYQGREIKNYFYVISKKN